MDVAKVKEWVFFFLHYSHLAQAWPIAGPLQMLIGSVTVLQAIPFNYKARYHSLDFLLSQSGDLLRASIHSE